METAITFGVEISVETAFQETHSNPSSGQFFFAYRISITNHNNFTIQLLRRHWYITNSFGETEEVEGEGVVGRQPVIYTGDSHEYVSGANLITPMGRMVGTYTFLNKQTGQQFKANIPEFRLEAPDALN